MKRVLPVYIDDDTRSEFERVAEAGHMNAQRYAATWISELSTLRPEFALKVLGLIPPEWKKRSVGRPPAAARTTDNVVPHPEIAAQDVG
jgi:hypothetical protein